jgi:hypothetical protein
LQSAPVNGRLRNAVKRQVCGCRSCVNACRAVQKNEHAAVNGRAPSYARPLSRFAPAASRGRPAPARPHSSRGLPKCATQRAQWNKVAAIKKPRPWAQRSRAPIDRRFESSGAGNSGPRRHIWHSRSLRSPVSVLQENSLMLGGFELPFGELFKCAARDQAMDELAAVGEREANTLRCRNRRIYQWSCKWHSRITFRRSTMFHRSDIPNKRSSERRLSKEARGKLHRRTPNQRQNVYRGVSTLNDRFPHNLHLWGRGS